MGYTDTYDYAENLIALILSGDYSGTAYHLEIDNSTQKLYTSILELTTTTATNGGAVAFSTMVRGAPGAGAGVAIDNLHNLNTLGQQSAPGDPHIPQAILFDNVIKEKDIHGTPSTTVNGHILQLKHIVYSALNTQEVQNNYQSDVAQHGQHQHTTWIFFRHMDISVSPFEYYIGYIKISPDLNYITIDTGSTNAQLPSEVGSDGSLGQANVFYLLIGPGGSTLPPSTSSTINPLPISTVSGTPALSDQLSWNPNITQPAPEPEPAPESAPEPEPEPVQNVTATGAACSIIPKNFNLF